MTPGRGELDARSDDPDLAETGTAARSGIKNRGSWHPLSGSSIPIATASTHPPVGAEAPWDRFLGSQYQLIREIGRGGYGVVHEALDVNLRRRVAIKTSHTLRGDEDLRREGQALAVINYPGLVQVHGLAEVGGRAHLIMEYLTGRPLTASLGPGETSVDKAIDIILSLAETLLVIHKAGFAHRDVKPNNIMVCQHRVVLMDLGLAVPEYAGGMDSRAAGSPTYMAPEVIDAALRPGMVHLADIYSLGVVAFELLTGHPPFQSASVPALLLMHLTRERPSVRASQGDANAALDALVQQMLAIDPHDRPPSMEVVVWALRDMRRRSAS